MVFVLLKVSVHTPIELFAVVCKTVSTAALPIYKNDKLRIVVLCAE